MGANLDLASGELIRGANGFSDIWSPIDKVVTPQGARSFLRADATRPYRLDPVDLRETLSLAPMEFTAAANRPLELALPTPGGDVSRFAIVEAPVMDPALAAQFPDIKTYRGEGIDDPTATIRLDYTPQGFHAQVLSPAGSFSIDPYFHLNQSVYAAYWRADVAGLGAEFTSFVDVDGADYDQAVAGRDADAPATNAEDPAAAAVGRASGTQLRTYRTAVAATGEYTAFYGATVSAGQAAIVTAVNRVTGIYEKELSVRLQLVANNSTLVFTDAATDPYSNNDGGAMLSQNQSTVDSRIGSANYDVGHVFSTGGGGVAYLRSVGQSFKAGGVTGLPSPTGDAFYVDYVAHEMGHQFGGNHTFNTSSDPNRSSNAAYEPGSGSTIMAYAGITGANSDLQNNSDPYFHWKSFEEIIGYLDDVIPTVGTRTATGNLVPTVNAGVDRTIPANTPFALTAVGADGNAADVLTYSWEQADLGPATLLTTADNGASPLFRVYNPTTSPTRTFPKLSSVLAGATTTASPSGGAAERLPTVNRAMDFRVTVRDNRAAGGGVNTDDVVLNVVNTGAAFAITNFNSATTLAGGSLQTVTWNVAGTTANGINAANVNVRLSTNGGNTFPILLASDTPNDGTQQVQIPYNLGSTTARIRVEPTNNVFFDINNANLTVTNVAAPASATPGVPVLAAGSDTGTAGDNRTRLNNSTASDVLQFVVSGTVSGAVVEILANGAVIGSATASGTSTTVTTTDTVTAGANRTLADGDHNITARQKESDKPLSAQSAALSITVDSAAPTANVVDVAADPRTTPVDSVDIVFTEAVTGLTVSDLSLTRDGGGNLLTGSESITASADNKTFTVGGLSALTAGRGTYVLALTAAGSGIADAAGNALAANASDEWVNSDALPTATAVFVGGTGWVAGFNTFLASSGAGEAAFGFRISDADQLNELPWTNLNKLSVRFSEAVNVDAGDLVIRGIRVATYALATTNGFAYDAATFTATWTLAASLANERLLLDLDADSVTDSNANLLDGEWADPVDPAVAGDTFPSGDGTAGGDFRFRLHVLPGDVNRNGNIQGNDVTLVRNAQGSTPGGAAYTIFKDVNGSANIQGNDVTLVRNRQGTSVPAGSPRPEASTSTASASPTTPPATAARTAPLAVRTATLQHALTNERLSHGLV